MTGVAMRFIFTVAALGFTVLRLEVARSQSRTVSGVVVDTGGRPLARAQVIVTSAARIIETGRDGRFQFSADPAATCAFDVLQSGYSVARVRLETCPDTAIRVVMRRSVPGQTGREFGPRCGTRSTETCTDRDAIRFIAVSSGQVHSCGITVDSVAYCWGDGRSGQLGNGQREIFRYPQRVLGNTRFAEVAAGGAYACARTAGGEVHCWGSERTVPGWPHQPEGPVRVMLDQPATSVTAGRRHACVLDTAGVASCWGWNVDGETGIGVSGLDQSMVPRPSPVLSESRFTSLSAGFGFTCGVTTDATVACWGSNVDYVLGETAPERCGDVGSVPCASRPVPIPLPERITNVSSGAGHACALGEREGVYCWGANASGQAGVFHTDAPFVRAPAAVTLPVQGRIVSLSSGGMQTCALTSTRRVYCWGADNMSYSQKMSRSDQAPRLAARGTPLIAVSTGQVHTCALDTSRRLRCWGDTILGALGIR
jgi:alpha-tubulin suppressor-like RCC1 family protein